ncbi:MAG: carboxylating nicotinate-nucleotide diphosphorylase [Bacteroidales bacterium]|jgi:nicotinate-nucleotide pyrophosphorylase (carboxylating)|nr:carboxylating nicotinate-nucleotide diphosphorylase [Bacteroidales bacterium]
MLNNIPPELLIRYLDEDIGPGDHSSLASIPACSEGKARLLVKEEGIIAGIDIAEELFRLSGNRVEFVKMISDGTRIAPGDIAFTVEGDKHQILRTERLALNILQRMSGIATRTSEYVQRLSGLKAKILDTRKTTPGFRYFEKEAVRIGGGCNHRMGLYDMIMLKDNHVDYAGGIEKAIARTREYLSAKNLDLRVEIETRNIAEIERVISFGGVDRIMLDNFTVEQTREAVSLIAGRFETESSGGITLETIRSYAECGVDYISVGALTHHINSLDLSLKVY